MKNKIIFYEKNSIEILYGKCNHVFPLHSHESFCIVTVLEGEALFCVNNQKCTLTKSMGCVIPSNTGVAIDSKPQYTYLSVCIKNELKDKFKNLSFENYFFKMNYNEQLLNICELFKENNDEKQFINSIETLINTLLTPHIICVENKNELVLNAAKYINEHVDKKFNLLTISDYIHVSKYHFIRVFKKEMGVTPNQYHIQAKLRIIKNDIVSQKENATDLAAKLNFSDQSHLCHIFKKQMGISLQDYKKNTSKI